MGTSWKRFKKQTPNFWQESRTLAVELYPALTVAFLRPIDWNKIQASTQKSDEPFHGYYNQLQIFFKENSHLPSDVESTWVAFNSMLVNILNWCLSFSVKRTRVEWETMSTPDLVNLANQLTRTLDESSKRKTAKILNFQLQLMKVPKQNQSPPNFCYYCEEPGHWKKDCHQLKCFRCL